MTNAILIFAKKNKVIAQLLILISKVFLTKHLQLILKWKLGDANDSLRFSYLLTKDSIVWDVGGYEGDWSDVIYKKYHPTIYIFEPVDTFVTKIKKRFANIRKIHVIPYGLSHKTMSVDLHLDKDGTSEFGQSGRLVEVTFVDINEILKKYTIPIVDLIEINIEGTEYALLEHMIKINIIHRFRNIQVQFHPFVKNAQQRVKRIQNKLKKTHMLTYQYPFIWENWTLLEK